VSTPNPLAVSAARNTGSTSPTGADTRVCMERII
jgi:hypothetical protein